MAIQIYSAEVNRKVNSTGVWSTEDDAELARAVRQELMKYVK